MTETHEFLVPSYFPSFKCKMGDCRAACCQGWPISITMENYFRLLGVNCSPALRRHIDCAVRMVDHPSTDVYARLNPRYDGDCAMRAEDGRCALQLELGEDILPDVCRLYPRGIRLVKEGYELSLANSCEAVLELLIAQTEPLSFSPLTMTINMPPHPIGSHSFETLGRERDMRMFFIRVMQDRTSPLYLRILKLKEILASLEDALRDKDEVRVDAILGGEISIDSPTDNEVDTDDLLHGLTVMEEIIDYLNHRSVSIQDQGMEILTYFKESDQPFAAYESAKSKFEEKYPNWEIVFENFLVNHMFFSLFPFQNRPESLSDELIALAGIYAILRFICIGWTVNHPTEEELIDVIAAAFRLIDHTEFDRYAARIMKKLGCTETKLLRALIML